MEIKVSLKQLTTLFAQSALDKSLPEGFRRFAARLTVLAAHVDQLEEKINGVSESTDKQLAEVVNGLQDIILAARGGSASAPQPAATQASAAPSSNPPAIDEDDEAKAMAERVIAETEAEAAQLAAKGQPLPPDVVPIRNGGGKKPAEEATS